MVIIIYLQSECILKSASLSYVQNMTENMAFTSYSGKSYLVASWGEYVDDVMQQVVTQSKRTIFVMQNYFHFPWKVTLYQDWKASRHCNSIFSLTTGEVLRHTAQIFVAFIRYILKH